MSFSTLGLHPSLVETLAALGYTEPTAVQRAAIPAVLAGGDLLVSSQTGSGKTAAFMLPALERLLDARAPGAPRGGIGPRVLVLAPTRELALQVQKATHGYGSRQRLRTACLVGGMAYGLQLKQLSRPVDVVVATPGRLKDHLERGRIDFAQLELLVLDEADRMLDMGFQEDIDAIVARTPTARQTLLFSATLEGVVGRLARRVTRDAKRIDVARSAARAPKIEQRALYTDDLVLRTPQVLHAHPVHSPHAHALIESIDTSEAAKLAGGFSVAKLAARDPIAPTWRARKSGKRTADPRLGFEIRRNSTKGSTPSNG